jgi:hypothetical protein
METFWLTAGHSLNTRQSLRAMLDAQPTTIVVPSFVKPFNVDAESMYEQKVDTSMSMI